MNKKKGTITGKLLVRIIILALILITAITFTVSKIYRKRMEEYYANNAFVQASIAANYIDGDKIKDYFKSNSHGGNAINEDGSKNYETYDKDDYYYEVKNYLQMSAEKMDAEYFYIVAVEKDVHVYIWDTGEGDETCELGDYEYYYGDGDRVMHEAYARDATNNILITNNDTYGYLASAYVAILDSNRNPVALASVDVSMDMINERIKEFVIYADIVSGIVLLIACALYFFDIRKIIVKPTLTLKDATSTLVNSDLKDLDKFHIDLKTNDEFEDVAESFEYMTKALDANIKDLESVTAEKNRIGAELDVAANIQLSMLPCIFPAFPDNKYIDIFASMTPAKEVGGDFYDFFFIDERHIAIVMADVSGKGIPAALFMVIGKTLIKDHTTLNTDLGEVFTTVNNMLCESNSEGLFITAFEGVLDLVTGEFRFVNAGHEMPFISRKNGPFEPQKIKPGFVLAGFEGMKYKGGEMHLDPGDKIFQYTDGVTEATRSDGELFGMDRLEATLNTVSAAKPDEILPAVKNAIDEFIGEAPQFDDLTMLCLEYKEKMDE